MDDHRDAAYVAAITAVPAFVVMGAFVLGHLKSANAERESMNGAILASGGITPPIRRPKRSKFEIESDDES